MIGFKQLSIIKINIEIVIITIQKKKLMIIKSYRFKINDKIFINSTIELALETLEIFIVSHF